MPRLRILYFPSFILQFLLICSVSTKIICWENSSENTSHSQSNPNDVSKNIFPINKKLIDNLLINLTNNTPTEPLVRAEGLTDKNKNTLPSGKSANLPNANAQGYTNANSQRSMNTNNPGQINVNNQGNVNTYIPGSMNTGKSGYESQFPIQEQNSNKNPKTNQQNTVYSSTVDNHQDNYDLKLDPTVMVFPNSRGTAVSSNSNIFPRETSRTITPFSVSTHPISSSSSSTSSSDCSTPPNISYCCYGFPCYCGCNCNRCSRRCCPGNCNYRSNNCNRCRCCCCSPFRCCNPCSSSDSNPIGLQSSSTTDSQSSNPCNSCCCLPCQTCCFNPCGSYCCNNCCLCCCNSLGSQSSSSEATFASTVNLPRAASTANHPGAASTAIRQSAMAFDPSTFNF